MRQLSGKVIRPLLKEVIMQNLSSVPLSFYLYLDQENQDCVSYLNSIKKLLESFSVPYVIGYYDKDKTKEENLSIFKAGISKHSVLLLRPLPIKEEKEFIDLIPSDSDPDMLSNINRGLLFSGDLNYLPATAKSVQTILSYYNIETENKNAVVIGRSLSLGLPCFELLNKKNANVTLLHSKTDEEKRDEYLKNADIIILASGHSGLVKKEVLKEGVTIIDCGFSSRSGDLSFTVDETDDINYTPVPGGVGALTSYCLLENAIYLKAKSLHLTNTLKSL